MRAVKHLGRDAGGGLGAATGHWHSCALICSLQKVDPLRASGGSTTCACFPDFHFARVTGGFWGGRPQTTRVFVLRFFRPRPPDQMVVPGSPDNKQNGCVVLECRPPGGHIGPQSLASGENNVNVGARRTAPLPRPNML